MTQNRDIERDAIWLAVVNSIRRDFPNSSMARQMANDAQAARTAAGWADHLKHIPAERVMGIYNALAMTAKNPPVISDFANTWAEMYEREWRTRQDEKREYEDEELRRQQASGAGRIGAKVSHMARQRWEAGLDAVCCDCTSDEGAGVVATLTSDEEYFCCQQRVCDFRQPVSRLMEIRVHPTFKPAGNLRAGKNSEPKSIPMKQAEVIPEVQKDLLTDEELIQQLEERCGMDCDKIETEYVVTFGKYFLNNYPALASWNRESARAAWEEFKGEFKGELKHANAA